LESSKVGDARYDIETPHESQKKGCNWMAKIALTGIKPTGIPHIGNYLGMIKPALELAQSLKLERFDMEDGPCGDGRTGRICGNRKGEKPCPI